MSAGPRPGRRPPPARPPRSAGRPGRNARERSSRRPESGTPATRPASAGVTRTVDTEYHHTVASTRRPDRPAAPRAPPPSRPGRPAQSPAPPRPQAAARGRAPRRPGSARPPPPARRRSPRQSASSAGSGGRERTDPYGVVGATDRGGSDMSETAPTPHPEARTFRRPSSWPRTPTSARRLRRGGRATGWRSGRRPARRLTWTKEWDKVLDWGNPPFAKWFVGGKLNVAYNCVDRHVEDGHGDQVAYYWEGEPGDTRTITYAAAPGRGLQGGQRAASSSASRPATGSPSTCR